MSTLDITIDTAPKLTLSNLLASERFCAADADVIFKSDDGTLFHIHSKNLETQAAGFPPAGFKTQNEIVILSEKATTLELLFQFVYPERHPYLDSVSFETLSPLAEAAEKYQIYSAMNICRVRMTNTLPDHAEEIMAYAVKHDYPDIMGRAAPLLLFKSLEEILVELPPNLIIPWIRYHGKWIKCAQTASLHYTEVFHQGLTRDRWGNSSTNASFCGSCSTPAEVLISKVSRELVKGSTSLGELDNTFNPSFLCCDYMKPALVAWRSMVEEDIKRIPSFTTFF